MDYRYLLSFERDARFDVLEHLAGMASPTSDGPTTVVLPDRTIELPFGVWGKPQSRMAWDDTSEPWDFTTVLWFPPDKPLEDYVRRDMAPGADARRPDGLGRLGIGFIYLSVWDETSTATGEELVHFTFGTPGTTMSLLFMDSESIRSSLIDLLASCRGVCGVFDMEDYADLIWLRGERRDDRLPTADLSLAEIEALVLPAPPAERPAVPATPLPLSFAAEQAFVGARHVRRTAGGSELGVHHWLVALDEHDERPRTVASRHALASGDIGAPLREDEVRDRATRHARQAGRALVSIEDIAVVVAEAARSD